MGSNYTSLTRTGVLSSDINFNGNLDLGSYNLTTTGNLTGSNIKNIVMFRYGMGGFAQLDYNPITTETDYTGTGTPIGGYYSMDSKVITSATNIFYDSDYSYLVRGSHSAKQSSGNDASFYFATSENADTTTNVKTDISIHTENAYDWKYNYPTAFIDYGDTIYARCRQSMTIQHIYVNALNYSIIKTVKTPITIANYSDYIDSIISIGLFDTGDIITLNNDSNLRYSGNPISEIYLNLENIEVTTIEVISGNPLLICKGV